MYNGLTNYETWIVQVWLTNEEYSALYWKEQATEILEGAPDTQRVLTLEQAATFELADRFKNTFEEAAADDVPSGVFSDLLGAALANVNWREMAELFVADAMEVNA